MVQKLALIILVGYFQIANAQPGAPTDAKAILTGPSKVPAGTFVSISAAGTVGNDPKITCVPENKDWQAGKSLSDDTITINFATIVPNKYYFFLAVNDGKKTAITVHEVQVGDPLPPPGPGPSPDQLYSRLLSAYQKETNVDGKNNEHKTKLVSFLRTFKTESGNVSTYGELVTLIKNSGDKILGDKTKILPNTRQEIGKILMEKFGDSATKPVDKELVNSTLEQLATSVEKIP